MKKVCGILVLMLVCFCGAARAQESDDVSKMRIAVPPFTFSGITENFDKKVEISEMLMDTFMRYLQKSQKVHLVDRMGLAAVMHEMDLQSWDQFDRSTAVRFGQQKGATHLILGMFHFHNNEIQVNVGLVAVETGEAVPGAAELYKTDYDSLLDAPPHLANGFHRALTGEDIPGYCNDSITKESCELQEIKDMVNKMNRGLEFNKLSGRSQGAAPAETDIRLELGLDRRPVYEGLPVYGQNGSMNIAFRTNKDCYIAIVNINVDGEVNLLYPNRWHTDPQIKGGVTYSIPGPDDDFSFDVFGKSGVEGIYAIASGEPFDTIEVARTKAIGGEQFPVVERNADDFMAKTVQVVEKKRNQGTGVQTATAMFYIADIPDNEL